MNPTADKPPGSKPTVSKPADDKPAVSKPTAEKPAPVKRARVKRPLPSSPKARLEMVLSCNKPCARPVKALKAQGASAPPAELRQLPTLVNQCVEQCR